MVWVSAWVTRQSRHPWFADILTLKVLDGDFDVGLFMVQVLEKVHQGLGPSDSENQSLEFQPKRNDFLVECVKSTNKQILMQAFQNM